MDKIIAMSTAEYKALFGNKNPNEVSNEDIKKARKKYWNNRRPKSDKEFKTWQEPGIITDEWSNQKVGIVTRTGFENEGF